MAGATAPGSAHRPRPALEELQARVNARPGVGGRARGQHHRRPRGAAAITLPIGAPVLGSIAVAVLIALATLPGERREIDIVGGDDIGDSDAVDRVVTVAPADESAGQHGDLGELDGARDVAKICGFAPARIAVEVNPRRQAAALDAGQVRHGRRRRFAPTACMNIRRPASSAMAKLGSWPTAAEMSLRACCCLRALIRIGSKLASRSV